MNDVGLFDLPGEITTHAEAEEALKTIAVAEAAEKLWARAKDPTKMMAAIKAKLHNQAAYAIWRPVLPSRETGGRVAEQAPGSDPGNSTIRRWRERLCKKIAADKKTRWQVDQDKLDAALDDAQKRCIRICEQENMGTIRGTEGTGEFERYTPAEYIEKAREVLGEIELDPATSEYAQKTVQATKFFTVDDDSLEHEWHGRVWLNPPYHRELAPKFIDKLINELAACHVTEAIVLTNNSTDTAWFRSAASVCDLICFTEGRIHFEVPNAKSVLPTQGQAFFYFGPHGKKFLGVFNSVGLCVKPV
jgi:phage N-6-adenine-methyltransferase